MQHRYDLIVFDWDGTLMDSIPNITSALQAASKDMGMDAPSDYQVHQMIGLGLPEVMQQLFPEQGQAFYTAVLERYRHHFFENDQQMRLFPKVDELLQTLNQQGWQLAIATGKTRKGLDRLLVSTNTKNYFTASRCADESYSKPNPAMLNELMQKLGVSAQRTLMVGDTSHDMQMAINAKVDGLAVSFGAHDGQSLQQYAPKGLLHDATEYMAWFLENA